MFKRLFVVAMLMAAPVSGQEKAFTLQSPPALTDTGLLRHLLPRFSPKTGIRITLADNGDAAFGAEGLPVFAQGDIIWHFSKSDGPYTNAFQEWLLSEVGKRTIEGFAPNGTAMFRADVSVAVAAVVPEATGDIALGERTSLARCGRCHVVNDSNRMKAIGSTPSFGLLRTFADWQRRFETFYLLKPHPAFTQVATVTDPFPDNLPSPIAPIEVTLEELDAIVAYVETIPPADLGAPVQSQ